jgi:glutathione S-transferase
VSEEYVLYQYPGSRGLPSLSPPCIKVQFALRLLQVPYRVENLRSVAGVRRISPTGRVPVLEAEGKRIADSIAILDFLEDRYPNGTLFPADPVERVHDRLWDHFATDSLYWIGLYHRWIPPDNRERVVNAMMGRRFSIRKLLFRQLLVRAMARRARGQSIGTRSLDEVNASAERCLRLVSDGLRGGPFLGGRAAPGRGDLGVATLNAQAAWRNTLPWLLERIRAHEGVSEHVTRTFEACGFDPPEGFERG